MHKREEIDCCETDRYDEDRMIEAREVKTLMDVRDRLGNLKDLVDICSEALECSKRNDIKTLIQNILYFQVREQITIADKELQSLWINQR